MEDQMAILRLDRKPSKMNQYAKEINGTKVIVYQYFDFDANDFVFQVRIPATLFSDCVHIDKWRKELSAYLDTLYEQIVSFEPEGR